MMSSQFLIDTSALARLMRPGAESFGWDQAVAATHGADPQASLLLVPALNTMFDVAASRTAVVRVRTPFIIYGLMGVVALVCAMLAGFHMAEAQLRSWVHIVGFAAIVAVTLYVIIDLENPHVGLIRINTGIMPKTGMRPS